MWDDYELLTLRKEYAFKTPIADIAAMLGKSVSAVKKHANRLGLVWGAAERPSLVGMAAPVLSEPQLITWAEEHRRHPTNTTQKRPTVPSYDKEAHIPTSDTQPDFKTIENSYCKCKAPTSPGVYVTTFPPLPIICSKCDKEILL